jgi:trk system potassium uptake protein TrkA
LDLALRKRYEVNIIAVKELDPDRFVMVPGPDFRVKEGDTLVILGRESALSKIKELN